MRSPDPSHARLARYFITYRFVSGVTGAQTAPEVGDCVPHFQSMGNAVVPVFSDCEEYRAGRHLRFHTARAAGRCPTGPLAAADKHIVVLTVGERGQGEDGYSSESLEYTAQSGAESEVSGQGSCFLGRVGLRRKEASPPPWSPCAVGAPGGLLKAKARENRVDLEGEGLSGRGETERAQDRDGPSRSAAQGVCWQQAPTQEPAGGHKGPAHQGLVRM